MKKLNRISSDTEAATIRKHIQNTYQNDMSVAKWFIINIFPNSPVTYNFFTTATISCATMTNLDATRKIP